MPRTVALLLSRACPNQVAPGNETEPQNADRVKQKTGLGKEQTPYPQCIGTTHQSRFMTPEFGTWRVEAVRKPHPPIPDCVARLLRRGRFEREAMTAMSTEVRGGAYGRLILKRLGLDFIFIYLFFYLFIFQENTF